MFLGEEDVSLGSDRLPYTTLLYGNGPGYAVYQNGSREDVSQPHVDVGELRSSISVKIVKYSRKPELRGERPLLDASNIYVTEYSGSCFWNDRFSFR